MNLDAYLSSKKSKSLLIGVGTVIGVRFLGLPDDVAQELSDQIVGLVSIAIGGFAAQDIFREKRVATEALAKSGKPAA